MRVNERPVLAEKIRVGIAICLLVVAAGLVVYRTIVAVSVGPAWDSFAFLANAAQYAGRGFGYTEPQRAPLISWLTALVFRATGRLDRSAIQWVDCSLTLVGLAAYFGVMRRRFPALPSALGVLALAIAPPVWAWTGVGYTDFASVAVYLLALAALIRANESSPWWYLLAAPLALAAVLTRVTALLLVIPLFVWFVLRGRLMRDTPYVAAGIAIAGLAYIPASQLYAERFGDRLFPFVIAAQIAAEQLTGRGFVTTEPGALSTFVLLLAGLFALTAVAGIVSAVGRRIAAQPAPRTARLVAGAMLLGAVLVTQVRSGLGARQAVLAVAVPALFLIFAPRDREGRVTPTAALDAVMIAWLASVGDWYGHNPIQVPRYTIGFLPALIYLVVLGVALWTERLQESPGGRVTTDGARLTMVGAAVLVIAVALASDLSAMPRVPDAASVAAEQTATHLAQADPGFGRRVIYSDVWPYTSWYLRTGARPMPTFEETAAVAHELDKSNADYYVALGDRTLEPTFTPVSEATGLRVWKRSRPAETRAHRALYLGHAWSNYLEQVTGYRFFLDSDAGSQGMEGTSFLDALPAEKLARWPVVAAYDVRWRDRVAGERALTAYLEGGGVLVFDASANFDRLGHSLADAGMFQTEIRRVKIDSRAPIVTNERWRASHPELPASIPARWQDETGSPWFGATYSPLVAGADFEVLATVGGEPLVAVQHLGRGRIYWVGSNLVWHAFRSGDPDEAALVSAIFNDAFQTTTRGAKTK